MINFIKLNIGNLLFILITLVLFIFPILGLVEIRIPIIIALSIIYFIIGLNKLNFLAAFILVPIITFYVLYFYNNEYISNLLSFWIMVFIGFIYHNKYNKLFKILRIILILNTFLVAYEFLNFNYIWNISEDPFFGRAKGLFSAPKEAGMFIAVFLIVYFDKISIIDFIYVLVTSLFIGSRTLFLICIVSFLPILILLYRNSKYYIKFIIYILLIVSIILFIYNFDFLYVSFEVIGRLSSLTNTEEGGNDLRIYVLIEGLKVFINSPLQEIFFGLGTKVEMLLGNGAENAYLNILLRYGIFGLVFFLTILYIPLVNLKSYGKFLYLFLLLILIGNRGLTGMLDSFIFFCYIGFLLKNKIKYDL